MLCKKVNARNLNDFAVKCAIFMRFICLLFYLLSLLCLPMPCVNVPTIGKYASSRIVVPFVVVAFRCAHCTGIWIAFDAIEQQAATKQRKHTHTHTHFMRTFFVFYFLFYCTLSLSLIKLIPGPGRGPGTGALCVRTWTYNSLGFRFDWNSRLLLFYYYPILFHSFRMGVIVFLTRSHSFACAIVKFRRRLYVLYHKCTRCNVHMAGPDHEFS